MGKVNLQDLEELEAKKLKKSLATEIQEKTIADVKIFKGPFLESWFDDYGECVLANSEAKRQAEYVKAGLDEFGRSREQVAMSKAKADLMAKKAKLFADIQAIDLQIQQLRADQFKEQEQKEEKHEHKHKGKK